MALSLSTAALGEPPAAQSGAAPSSPGKARLDTVTVEGKREKKEVEREVSQFVSAVPVRYPQDSLSRCDTPVCPLVAGLPAEPGEFMLARLSQIVSGAKAPLAGERCKPNFYVVLTREPQALIRNWQARDPRTFNTRDGTGYLRRFRDTPRAVRVWYNADFVSSEGRPISPDAITGALVGAGAGLNLGTSQVSTNSVGLASRLTYTAVRSRSSVIVVVDVNRIEGLNFGQLADYIGMVGLAEVDPDAKVGQVPTILRLFRGTPDPPRGLSAWDEAFLAALYGVDQASITQGSRMKRQMVSTLVPGP